MEKDLPEALVVSVYINKTIGEVWNTWANKDLMHNWLFINDDFKTTELNVDFVTGGHFSYVMASKVGDLKYEYKATYSSIRPFEKILMTLDDGRKANVLFSTSEQRTFMQMEFEPYPYQDSRAQILGWQAILDNFKKFVESI